MNTPQTPDPLGRCERFRSARKSIVVWPRRAVQRVRSRGRSYRLIGVELEDERGEGLRVGEVW